MDVASCDMGPLADRDTPPPDTSNNDLPLLKIMVVDCKQVSVLYCTFFIPHKIRKNGLFMGSF